MSTDTEADSDTIRRAGIDAAALKPSEHRLCDAVALDVGLVTIDYEGREHLPDSGTIERLAREFGVRVTVPVRADGFDPLGDDRLYDRVPDAAGLVLVAGHPAYLSAEERGRPIAPRLDAALSMAPDAWVGTEGIERVALATGATQFELLSPTTERDVRALRAAGFGGGVAVYAPTVVDADEDAILDAVGAYVARRGGVRERLPEGSPTDRRADGRAREVLLEASDGFALTGGLDAVRDRVATLREAGADRIVAYPAAGIGRVASGE